jgi:hypothetical protein
VSINITHSRADKCPELTAIRSKTPEAAVIETKLDNVASERPIDCARVRHTRVVGPVKFANSNSAGEQVYPSPSLWSGEQDIA